MGIGDIGRSERRLIEDSAGGRRPDQIEICGLEVFAHHGVYDHERRDGQRFVIDVTIDADTHIAARTDDVSDTLDYGTLITEIAQIVRGTQFSLLEALAAHVADALLERRTVSAAAVRIHKPDVALDETVSHIAVTVRRSRPTRVS